MLPDDYHGIVNILNTQYDSEGSPSCSPSSSWNGSWQSAVLINGTNDDNTDSDSGYTVEIKIPWTSIGYPGSPAGTTMVRMGFALNDKDASLYDYVMWPSGTGTAFENASNWQQVLLLNNHLPSAEPGGPYSAIEGQVITLDGSDSADADGTIVLYQWDINNDGACDYVSSSSIQSHTYAQQGTYTIKLRVTDNNGAISEAATTAII
jgi:PKD repeat protein